MKKRKKRKRSGKNIVIFSNPVKKEKINKSSAVNNVILKNKSDIKIVSDERILTNKSDFKNYYINVEPYDDKNFSVEIINPKKENNKLDNFELNNLEYDEALKIDRRRFLNIYWSILKREHIILFTFFIRNDHNLTLLKFIRFIFLVCTDMAMNVFFFSDETMHKMFLDYGKYNFIQQIPQIVYSTIVSNLLELVLCYLSLTDKYFYQMKNLDIKDNNNNTNNIKVKILKCIRIKIHCFFAFTFLIKLPQFNLKLNYYKIKIIILYFRN